MGRQHAALGARLTSPARRLRLIPVIARVIVIVGRRLIAMIARLGVRTPRHLSNSSGVSLSLGDLVAVGGLVFVAGGDLAVGASRS